MSLPKDNPVNFCKAFIQRELDDNKEKRIWMSYWPVMESMIERADELKLPFEELVNVFGYSDRDIKDIYGRSLAVNALAKL